MMAWRRSGDKPLSESIMAISPVTHTVIGLGQSHDNAMGRDIRRVCWVNHRTQYCWIFMKFTENNGNVNATLSEKYQTDMLEIVSSGSYPAGLILILGSRINFEENNLPIFSSGPRAHKSNSWRLVARESLVISKKTGVSYRILKTNPPVQFNQNDKIQEHIKQLVPDDLAQRSASEWAILIKKNCWNF